MENQFTVFPDFDPRYIAHDGESIWEIDNSNSKTHQFDSNGQSLVTFDNPSSDINGNACDTNFIWLLESENGDAGRIYKYDHTGLLIETYQAGDTIISSSGLAKFGNTFYILSNDIFSSTNSILYKVVLNE